jgi:hypothetical protein
MLIYISKRYLNDLFHADILLGGLIRFPLQVPVLVRTCRCQIGSLDLCGIPTTRVVVLPVGTIKQRYLYTFIYIVIKILLVYRQQVILVHVCTKIPNIQDAFGRG